jgi:hypothetical protein
MDVEQLHRFERVSYRNVKCRKNEITYLVVMEVVGRSNKKKQQRES